MTIYDKIKDENYDIILIEKHKKDKHYHQVKLININTLEQAYSLIINNNTRS